MDDKVKKFNEKFIGLERRLTDLKKSGKDVSRLENKHQMAGINMDEEKLKQVMEALARKNVK